MPTSDSIALTLPSYSSPEADQGLFIQAFKGIWYGAVAGFEIGQVFCGPWGEDAGRGYVGLGNGESTLGLAVLVLCGGGIVGGVSVGAAYGVVAPFVSSPPPTEILIARERVIQGIWERLVHYDHEKELGSSYDGGDSQNLDVKPMVVGFGVEDLPYSGFMRIEPVQVGLFSKSKFDQKNLILLWDIRVIFFDSRHRIVAKQVIEIEQGEYQFDEWAEHEAELLKAKLKQGYQLAMEQIVEKLSTP